jgi:hypothetical protein
MKQHIGEKIIATQTIIGQQHNETASVAKFLKDSKCSE